MKKAFQIIILIALVGLTYKFWPQIIPKVAYFEDTYIAPLFRPAPCTHPILYTLSAFDTRFNITKSYFLSALTDAETIWEKSFGKELFTYSADNPGKNVLKVKLVYDYRQEATNKLASLGIGVENNRASYDALKQKFTALQKKYNDAKNAFNAKVSAFNAKNAAYETDVAMWNRKGGAPKSEYNRLEEEHADLRAESDELKTEQAALNSMADELNALVVALNRLVDSLNLSVTKYNTTNNTLGESFEEGVYSTDGTGRSEIDIYEFSNRTKLVRVLAHELGHALGIGHVKDPKAIMYEKNQSNSLALTVDDFTALKTVCRVK